MTLTINNMPQHVAIIMDGNGRWAKQKGKLRIFGHRNGVQAVRRAVSFAANNDIKYLTLYAFSSENWERPQQEVNALMELFLRALDSEVDKLDKANVRLNILGDISRFSEKLQQKIRQAEHKTAANSGLVLNIAANYGGRWDIINATKKIASLVAENHLTIEDIDEKYFASQLVTQQQPMVDLLIRTSGEQRISNFLLWQIAYAELYFSPVLWPDFDESAFRQAIEAYQQRERRFGGV